MQKLEVLQFVIIVLVWVVVLPLALANHDTIISDEEHLMYNAWIHIDLQDGQTVRGWVSYSAAHDYGASYQISDPNDNEI